MALKNSKRGFSGDCGYATEGVEQQGASEDENAHHVFLHYSLLVAINEALRLESLSPVLHRFKRAKIQLICLS